MSSIARTVSFNWKYEIVRKLRIFTLSYFQNINEEWTEKSAVHFYQNVRDAMKKINLKHNSNRGLQYFFSNLKSKYINK